MQKYFFTTIIIVLIMVTFAMLNAKIVEINFGFTTLNISLALTLFIVFAIGSLVSFLFSFSKTYKLTKENKRLKKDNQELITKADTLNEKINANITDTTDKKETKPPVEY